MDDVIIFLGHVFLDIYHEYCYKSVDNVVRCRAGWNTIFNHLFWQTCKSYIISDYNKTFVNCHVVCIWLANINHAKWERSYFPNIRWNLLNMDMLVAIQMLLVHECNLPIKTIIEVVYEYTQHIFLRHSNLGGKNTI